MSAFLLIAAGLAGLTAVAAGAFGAHALKDGLTPEMLAIFQTAALYHLVHAVALFGTALLSRTESLSGIAVAAGIAFLIGILIFSGSLYLLSITGTRWLGAITPLGGVAFMVGWALLIWSGWKSGT